MKIELCEIAFPPIEFTEDLPQVPAAEYEQRLASLYQAANADWVVVYGDREHYGNLTYLVNFDPRFEEVLLVLGPNGARALVVGNEDMGYGGVLPFPIEMFLAQSFSLLGQQRDTAPSLAKTLAAVGIRKGQVVSLVGWKYLEPFETATPSAPSFVPAFIVDTLWELVGTAGRVVDGTVLMMHPEQGLRAINSAAQVAVFEWAARNASAAVFNVLRGVRPGMSEMQAMRLSLYAGMPQSMHPIFASGKRNVIGLGSATRRVLEYGDSVSTAIGYWGSLVCRAGMLLGEVDQGYFQQAVAPYFGAVVSWYRALRVGAAGGEVYQAAAQAFEGSGLRSALNPGHLTSYDEWLHSPIRPNSAEKIRSGMVFQADIIPTPLPEGWGLNCEDTVAVADEDLRAEIRSDHPQMWTRICARREAVAALGIELDPSILPLTDATAYLPPFWLLPTLVCAAV